MTGRDGCHVHVCCVAGIGYHVTCIDRDEGDSHRVILILKIFSLKAATSTALAIDALA